MALPSLPPSTSPPAFGQEKAWISREGIVIFGGSYAGGEDIRMPSPINIFSALTESLGYKLSLSPAGRVCEQIIAAVGNIKSIRTVVRSLDLLKMLDRMAHANLEIEIEEPDGKRKSVKKGYAPLAEVLRVLGIANAAEGERMEWHLAALTRCNVLRVGMALKCDSCQSSSWFGLEELQEKLHCPRCLANFSFPVGIPPGKSLGVPAAGPVRHG
jgi:hypothetical protein